MTEIRKLIQLLDVAVDEYECGSAASDLASILDMVAAKTAPIDPSFSARVTRLSARTMNAFDPSQRDIVSTMTRDVRRDLMCTVASRADSRNECAPSARNAQTTARDSGSSSAIQYLGD